MSPRECPMHWAPCAVALWRPNAAWYQGAAVTNICEAPQITQHTLWCSKERRWAQEEGQLGWWGRHSAKGQCPAAGPGGGWCLHLSAQCPGSHQQQQLRLRASGVGGAIKTPWLPAAVGLQHRCSGRFSTGSSFHSSWLLLLWHCAAPVKVTAPHTLTPSHHLRPGPLQFDWEG